MANHGNHNYEAGIAANVLDKKAWNTPRMEKLDVSVHTKDTLLGLLQDGLLGTQVS